MQHSIDSKSPIGDLGAWEAPIKQAVNACVHCGFCLPSCPTYRQLGEEMDSPRGRIFLIKEVLEGRVRLEDAVAYTDRCLGCVGCESACPSGVHYGALLTPFRALAESTRRRPIAQSVFRGLLLKTISNPRRFRLAVRLGQLAHAARKFMPRRLKSLVDVLPEAIPAADRLPEFVPAEGDRRGRVALLAGCAQQVLAPEINRSTIRLLTRNGVDVVIPKSQTCCGALAAHTGSMNEAQKLARQNLQAFRGDVDAVITNAAGCGSGMREYGLWLAGTEVSAAATELARKTVDVSVYLDRIGTVFPMKFDRVVRVAYHDACHLAHAQGVRLEPRRLLKSIENLELVEIPNGNICCGSAGTYNLEQPEIAAGLGRDKVNAIANLNPDVVVSGNIGCLAQLRAHAKMQGLDLKIMHTMELLDHACGGSFS